MQSVLGVRESKWTLNSFMFKLADHSAFVKLILVINSGKERSCGCMGEEGRYKLGFE